MKIIELISRLLSYVGVGLVLPMMLLIIADVITRSFFNAPITGTAEISCLMLVCMSLGMAWCAIKDMHLKIEIIMSRFSRRVQALIDCLTLLGGLVIVIIMAWQNYIAALWRRETHQIASILLPIPLYPFHLLLAFGLSVLGVVMVTLVIQKIIKVFTL